MKLLLTLVSSLGRVAALVALMSLSGNLVAQTRSIALSIDSVTPGGASPSVTAGDVVVYRATVTLSDGTTSSLGLTLDLPAGFQTLWLSIWVW